MPSWILWAAIAAAVLVIVAVQQPLKENAVGGVVGGGMMGQRLVSASAWYTPLVDDAAWRKKPESPYNYTHTIEYGAMSLKRYRGF